MFFFVSFQYFTELKNPNPTTCNYNNYSVKKNNFRLSTWIVKYVQQVSYTLSLFHFDCHTLLFFPQSLKLKFRKLKLETETIRSLALCVGRFKCNKYFAKLSVFSAPRRRLINVFPETQTAIGLRPDVRNRSDLCHISNYLSWTRTHRLSCPFLLASVLFIINVYSLYTYIYIYTCVWCVCKPLLPPTPPVQTLKLSRLHYECTMEINNSTFGTLT